MECKQNDSTVAVTGTLFENFLNEKCECDLSVPDYFPPAEKIIQCTAEPVITVKNVTEDRLDLEGICKITVIYQGEEDGEIKSLNENTSFAESFTIKKADEPAWVQTLTRVSTVSCRLLNPRKISCSANVSIALKVKSQKETPIIESLDCGDVEALFLPITNYVSLNRPSDTTRIQAEIETEKEIRDILNVNGNVCIKEQAVFPGKAVIKGNLSVRVLFTAADDPSEIRETASVVPFTQSIAVNDPEGAGTAEMIAAVQNLRADIEADHEGKNRVIVLTATILTEGEIYDSESHHLLVDAYSNKYQLNVETEDIETESLTDEIKLNETLKNEISFDTANLEVLDLNAKPIIQKVAVKDQMLAVEGVLDTELFIREDGQYRAVDKVFPFTLKAETKMAGDSMRCEIHPCVNDADWTLENDSLVIRTNLSCHVIAFMKNTYRIIKNVSLDTDHPLEEIPFSPVIVYFAEKGERLWDIARKYGTSVSLIKEVNEMDEDTVEEKRLLLIS